MPRRTWLDIVLGASSLLLKSRLNQWHSCGKREPERDGEAAVGGERKVVVALRIRQPITMLLFLDSPQIPVRRQVPPPPPPSSLALASPCPVFSVSAKPSTRCPGGSTLFGPLLNACLGLGTGENLHHHDNVGDDYCPSPRSVPPRTLQHGPRRSSSALHTRRRFYERQAYV